ncbi:MAG TPA: Gfo/Idh/MocA family oxidoreductase [Planctomycetaceae bacterium]|nr:Gfo/Idh/MocA family oxidoreductase [Planctomycetaceae bacterium]
MATPVRVGLIGYGAWGRHHARALSAISRVQLVAICARSDESAAAAISDYPDATIYRNYQDLLIRSDLDLCDVVLPSDLHFEVGQAVLASGRHLVLEKPMTLSLAEGERLIELAAAKQRVFAVGHELRLSSLWGKVKQLIDAGAIGEPLYALIELWRRPYRLGSGGWRYDITRVGNWILEEPIHFFDLARWYFSGAGEPVSVFAQANGKRPEHPELHDNFSAIVTFPHGRYAVISQTLAAWEHHQVAKLTGTNGALWASWSGAMDRTFEPTFSLKLQTGDDLETISIEKPSGEVFELQEQLTAVVAAVETGSPVPCTGEDGLWSVRMCLKAAESLRTGLPVVMGSPTP